MTRVQKLILLVARDVRKIRSDDLFCRVPIHVVIIVDDPPLDVAIIVIIQYNYINEN